MNLISSMDSNGFAQGSNWNCGMVKPVERTRMMHGVDMAHYAPAVDCADTAMISALSSEPQPDRDRLFETMIFNHLRRSCSSIRYTTEQGGCDFVATDSDGAIRCVQACREDDSDRMQDKIDGLLYALRATGLRKGTIVTETGSERILRDGLEIEITDADAFLSETA